MSQSLFKLQRHGALVLAVLGAALLSSLLVGSPLHAYTLEEFRFETPAQEAEFRGLIGKLRCLVCQNESLAASQAGLARDLRLQVYNRMRDGASSEEIVGFLVDRYGDFVLYEPPLKPSTYLLWFGPLVLIGIAAAFLLRALLVRKTAPEQDLSPAERERLQRLLATGDTEPNR